MRTTLPATSSVAMRTLICIDGNEHALKAARLAAKSVCTTNSEATFLFVRRYGKDTRGYNIRRKTTEIFANWREQLPEMRYLHEAEDAFQKAGGRQGDDGETEELHRALVHVGNGVLEEGMVRLRSTGSTRLKIREGVPHEEIVREAEDGHYDLVMLGARVASGCHWYETEHIPLSVAQRAPCPVAVIGKEFEERKPVLVCVGNEDLPRSTFPLVQVIAANMNSKIEVLTVRRTNGSDFQFSQKVASMIGKWSAASLNVTPKVLTGDPVKVILEIAPNYGLIVCSHSRKRLRNRLGKVTKKVLCRQFNTLVSR